MPRFYQCPSLAWLWDAVDTGFPGHTPSELGAVGQQAPFDPLSPVPGEWLFAFHHEGGALIFLRCTFPVYTDVSTHAK